MGGDFLVITKNWKVLGISWNSENFSSPPQTCAPKNFRWCQWGAKWSVERTHILERGPPSTPAEILSSNVVQPIKPKTNFQLTWFHRLSSNQMMSFMIDSFYSLGHWERIFNVSMWNENGSVWNLLILNLIFLTKRWCAYWQEGSLSSLSDLCYNL